MGLNRELLGKVYQGPDWEVTVESTRAYAAAYGDDNQSFLGGGEIVAPPMYGVVFQLPALMAPLFDPDLEVNMGKLVHGEERMRYLVPVKPGDTISSKAVVAAIEEKSSGEVLDIALESVNQDGVKVCESKAVMFIRGKKKDGGEKQAEDRKPEPAEPPPREVLLTRTLPTTKEMPAAYAEASGDRNPIHLDEGFAQAMGLPGCIVHGLCSMAISQKVVIDALCDGDPLRLKSYGVRFSGMVIPGDELTTEVYKLEETDALLKVGVEVKTQNGDAVITMAEAEIAK